MDAPAIIFTCLAISLLLLCLICGFFACLYHSTKFKKEPMVVRKRSLPPRAQVNKAYDHHEIVVVDKKQVENGEREIEFENKPVPAAVSTTNAQRRVVNRPSHLKINTSPQIAAQSAIAVETDHAADHFLREMAEPSENRTRLIQDEFEVLSKTEARRTTRSGDMAARHRDKNRYADIVPYDHTLVDLVRDQYINASFVQGENDALRFIATQAPIGEEENRRTNTVPEFWLMVIQHNVECIVMLTDLFENYTQKSALYWPSAIGYEKDYGTSTVKLVSETHHGQYVHRELDVISEKGRRHNVSQYQYKNWKDNEVPDTKTFLNFLETIRGRRYKSPIVVHCSAGIGRTGVYICTENIIRRIENEGIVDVFSEVNRARQQRASMVHTLAQYEAIYDIIALYLRRQNQIRN